MLKVRNRLFVLTVALISSVATADYRTCVVRPAANDNPILKGEPLPPMAPWSGTTIS
jgi:hypothetical protein